MNLSLCFQAVFVCLHAHCSNATFPFVLIRPQALRMKRITLCI